MKKADSKMKAMILLEKKLIFLPIMLILLRIWGTVRYFLFIFNKDSTVDNVMKILQVQVILF